MRAQCFVILRAVAAAALLVAAMQAYAAVGFVQFSAGDVKIRDAAGQVRDAVKGTQVNEGDTIVAAPGASAQLKMMDGGIIAVRPETELKVATYKFAGKEDGSERAVLSLLKGGFRTITGLIGHTNKQNYHIETPTAVIGIRGTDHEPFVIPAIAAGGGKPAGLPGTYDKVNVGVAVIRSQGAEVSIRQNQVGYAAPGKTPVLLPAIPGFFKATPPVRASSQGQKKEEQEKQQAAAKSGNGSQSSSSSSSSSTSDDKKESQTASSSSSGGSSSSSSDSSSSASTSSSTSSTTSGTSSTTNTASDVRASSVVDPTSTTSTAAATTTTSTVAAAVTTTPVAAVTTATSTAVTTPAVVQTVTATASDNTALNLTAQTATSSSGTTTDLTQSTTVASSPSVSSSNYASVVLSQTPAGSSTQEASAVSSQQSNTTYSLDQKKALLEVQHAQYSGSTTIADADVKLTGGKVVDVYADDASTMYIGRQQGGSLTAKQTGGSGSASETLGDSSAHWLVAVQPAVTALSGSGAAISNVQTIVGTTAYSLAGATHPTDAKGNVGTLSTAVIAADFSNQLVNAVLGLQFSTSDKSNLSTRDLSLSAVAANVPIRLGGFNAAAGTSTAPRAVCTGAGCAAQSYQGNILGYFGASSSNATSTTSGIGSSVGLTYSFSPFSASPSSSVADLIQGAAVLSALGSPPVTGVVNTFGNSNDVRHDAVYDTFQSGSTVNANNVVVRDTYTLSNPTTTTLSGLHVNTNYLFDSSGNLVRIFDTPYVVVDHGTNVSQTTTGYAVPTPISDAQVSMGGLGATAANTYSNSTIGIRMGRWKGGQVTVTDLATGSTYLDTLDDRSLHWLVRSAPVSLPVTGIYQYTRVAATDPTDSYGNVGTLDRARLLVDFGRSTVSAGVAITMPSGSGGSLGSQSLTGYFNDAPLTSTGFNVSSNASDNAADTDNLHVNCRGAGCAANQTYGGRIRGALSSGSGAANSAEGAYFRYSFVTNYADATTAAAQSRSFDDYIDGIIAFQQTNEIVKPSLDIMGTVTGASPTVTPAGDARIVYGYNWLDNTNLRTQLSTVYARGGNLGGYLVDASGALVSATEYFDETKQIAGSNPTSSFTDKVTTSSTNAFTIAYGDYVAPTVTGKDSQNASFARATDTFQWIRGPAIYPFYLAMITENPSTNAGNSVGYATLGGRVTDQNGLAGTINSASLTANFGGETVSTAVNATVGSNTFSATANGISFNDMGEFWAVKNGPTRHSFSTLTRNGSGSGVSGTLQGSLMGPGLEAAGFVFDFTSSTARAMGSVVFGNPTYSDTSGHSVAFSASTTSGYQLGLIASGMNNSIAGLTNVSGGTLSEDNLYRADIGANAPSRVQFVDYQTSNPTNPAWTLTKFDGTYPFAYGCTGSVCTDTTEIAARYAITDATGSGPLPANNSSIPAPTAKALEAYYDPSTGIRWGRWGGGYVNVGDRASGSGTGGVPNANGSGGTTNQIDLSVNNWHYLVTGVQSGPMVLPVSGTFTYSLIGNTSPTSFTPGQTTVDVGTLTSASLIANFTNKTVDVGVNLTTPASGAWSASATAVPILKDTGFSVEKSPSGVSNALSVLHNNSATGTAGKIVGGFAGLTGQGAGIAYSLNAGGATGTTVSGVAAFKR